MARNKRTVRKNSTVTSVETVVLSGVTQVLRNVRRGGDWTGTMTELNRALVSALGRRASASLPGSPSALRVVLNRVVRKLRSNGVSVRFGRTTDHARTRYVSFSR